MTVRTADRYRGALLGLAAGDAVGTTVEFEPPGSFAPVENMVGGGPFHLKPGEWTDDTSMALCLAASLVECRGFDANDQMSRYIRWWREGYMSSNGRCFDIGNTVSAALRQFERTGDPFSGSTDPRAAGNGSIMRLAPVPLAYAGDARAAVAQSAESSRTTHGAPTAVDACRYLGGLIAAAANGVDKNELLSPRYGVDEPLEPEIDEIAAGSFKQRKPPEIKGSGFVVRSLEAALWAFATTDDFRSGCLAAVNLGDDADTTAAVYGQLAGAVYGVEDIPADWRTRLALHDTIVSLADDVLVLSNTL
jgi:ADP-ribosyl-[dinitrogen reductase] hydrolase